MGGRLGDVAALSPDGHKYVFSVVNDLSGGAASYYTASVDQAVAARAFSSDDLPGRVIGMWVGPAGVLTACSDRDKLCSVVYYTVSTTQSKPKEISKAQPKVDVAKLWPDAPRKMALVSYTGGYSCDLASGKTDKLFDYSKLGRTDEYWRSQVRNGILYPQDGGGYASVSMTAGKVDIRVLNKDGIKNRDLLPRG